MKRRIRAPRGRSISCRGWQQEAALRMLMNNLDPEVAEKPQDLIVYGGSGRAARSWEAYDAIVASLQQLKDDETLLIQSGKPVGIFQTQEQVPRVLLVNSLLVPAWSSWEVFRDLERKGLTMYGQMTAGSWIYIGTQGILQGTYETLAQCAREMGSGSLKGKLVLTAGLGGMGGAQPLAITMNGGVGIIVEVDEERIKRRIEGGYCDCQTASLDEALTLAQKALQEERPLSIGLLGNAAQIFPQFVEQGVIPHIVTDQTSAHDILHGYIPKGFTLSKALALRQEDPETYQELALDSIALHVEAMLNLQKKGAVVFDYGNNIRAQALGRGVENAFDFPGFVPTYIRPLFCEGKGPFRWVALSGSPEDIYRIDDLLLQEFSQEESLVRWIQMAREKVSFQGLPSRICWLGYGERARFGLLINRLVQKGELKAPIVIGRDHLDTGSVASPNRETEGMKDGSDAIADWPILNALLNSIAGASWVSVHHGGGVGIGYSLHAGMVVVADGQKSTDERLERVLTTDPGTGIIRHADAGYKRAIETARAHSIPIPMGGETP